MNGPLVSMPIFAYNQERYIRDAILGAFSQTYSPLEIIISDDCSQDRTFEIIQEEARAYNGPHKVVVNRNERNLGLVQHFNNVIFHMLSGELIVPSGGDDVALDSRAAVAARTLQTPGCLAGFSNGWAVNAQLENPVPLHEGARGRTWKTTDGILMASSFYRRSLLVDAGPLPDYMWGEGVWITAHALAKGDILYTPEYTLKYRKLLESMTGAFRSGNRDEVIRASRAFQRILSATRRDLFDRGLYYGKAKKFISALWQKSEFKMTCLDESKGMLDRFVSWAKCVSVNPSVLRDFTDIIRPDQALH